MISKERLEELISQEATIYSARIKVREISLNDLIQIYTEHGEDVIVFGYEPNDWEELKDLYETRKEAEWHLKYYATRTEELNLPYWTDIEEHKDDDIYKIASFRRKNAMSYNLLFKRGDLMLWSVQELMNVWIDLATEENYTKLCDLCLKLFKGELE